MSTQQGLGTLAGRLKTMGFCAEAVKRSREKCRHRGKAFIYRSNGNLAIL
jgi:hypothetical protein